MNPQPIHTIVIYPRPHADNICAIFLLRTFGQEQFPGIHEATIAYWNQVPTDKTAEQWEEEGYLLVDLGSGKFDHHHDDHESKTDCASTLIAKHLGIDQDPALRKLLQYVRRDDLEGRGIVSKDIIDRAFGLSAIIMNLNRDYPDHPDYVIDTVSRIYLAHYNEEYRRKVLMPQEWQALQASGRARKLTIATPRQPLRVAIVETDSKAMIGFLRAIKSIQADVVVQKTATGHVNIVTRQATPRLDLRETIKALRLSEARATGADITHANESELTKPGRSLGIDEWYFDTAANTLQNGGAAIAGITPTRLSLDTIQAILEKTLPASVTAPTSPPDQPRTISLGSLSPRPPRLSRRSQRP